MTTIRSLYKNYLVTAASAMLVSAFVFQLIARPVATIFWTLGVLVALTVSLALSVPISVVAIASPSLFGPTLLALLSVLFARHKRGEALAQPALAMDKTVDPVGKDQG